MQSQLPLYPEQASNFAPSVDALMVYITAGVLVFRRGDHRGHRLFLFQVPSQENRATSAHRFTRIRGSKLLWLVVPAVLALTMFAGGAVVYVDFRRAPMDTLDIYVIGKQWMWKVAAAQWPEGN